MGFFSSDKIEPELLNPQALQYYNELMGLGQAPSNQLLTTAGQPYSGKFTADIGGLQQLGLKSIGELLESPIPTKSPIYTAATSELEKTIGGTEYDPITGPYYSAYRGNIMRELQQAKDRLAHRSSAADAMFGGGRLSQERELEEGAMGSLSQILGSLFETERTRRLEAIPQALQTLGWAEQVPITRAQAAYSLDLPALLEQQRLDRTYQDYLAGRGELANILGIQSGLAEPVYSTPQYAPSEFSQLMGGGLGQGLGAGAGYGLMTLLSDENVKQNIKTIENALHKLREIDGKTYNYIFKSANERDAGVIAQEVEMVMPEAVVEKNGIKYVKLDAMVGLLVNAVNELSEEMMRLKSALLPDLN